MASPGRAESRSREEPRYRDLAARLGKALRAGVYPPGARLPSVRELCRTWDASITTVVAAYHLLERDGLVESRAQSGHYARPPADPARPAPAIRTRLEPTRVDLGQLALMVMKDSLDPALVPFGPAMPDPALLPSAELHRLLGAIARERDPALLRYGVPPGAAALRQAVARRAAGFGCAVAPDSLVVTAGALEALTLALRATCRAGQTIAIESPAYYGLLQSIEALGLSVIELPTDRHGLSLAALREALDEHQVSAVVAMPCAGNPLGTVVGDEAKRDLVELLTARGIPLIEDDALGDLAHDGSRPRPAKAFDREGLVLWCSSASKTAAPGLRVGWLAAGRYQAAVEHLQFTNGIGAAPLNQELLARFIAGGGYERHLRRVRPLYAARCTAMAAAVLAAFPAGTRIEPPRAGYCLWVELPEGCEAQALYAAALDAGIAITPGTLFSAKARYRRFIRLTAATWDAGDRRQADGLRQLGRLVAAAGRGTRPASGGRAARGARTQ